MSIALAIDWCSPSNSSLEIKKEGVAKKDLIEVEVLQKITKSKDCEQMISRLKKTRSLDLSHQNIEDISILVEADLEILLLRDNPISDLSVLQHHKKLKILDISHTSITASQIAFLPNSLEVLYAEYNNLQDIDFRKMCSSSSIKVVGLRHSQINQLDSFHECRKLSFLGLEGNNISDISTIRGLRNIKSIDLYGNPIKDCPVNKKSNLYERCVDAMELNTSKKEALWEEQNEK